MSLIPCLSRKGKVDAKFLATTENPNARAANYGRSDAPAYTALVSISDLRLVEDLRSPSILTGSKTYDAVFTLVQSMDERPRSEPPCLTRSARRCGKVMAAVKILSSQSA
jgi:hypothetical protein